ncbi:MAG: hypothetical protein RJA22_1273 [Verrucomicrobiota bacterium]
MTIPCPRTAAPAAEFSRREWLKLGAAGAAGLVLAPARAWAHPGHELRIPPDWAGGTLTAAPGNLEIWPGTQTPALTLNGLSPGPTLRLRPGTRLEATVVNQLTGESLVLHWHGLLGPAAFDGHPRQAVAPGASYAVSIPIVQPPAPCWYHAHTHGATASQVYRGLAGLLLIDDPERDAALGLPTGARDVPLVLRDWKSNTTYSLTYAPSMFEHMWGYLGNTMLVNGTPQAWFAVDQGLWRFRVLNGCNARILRLGFSDGRTFHVIGSDGGLTGLIEPVTFLDLAPGQRAEVLVSFAGMAVGASVVLRSLAFPIVAPLAGPAGPRQGDALDILTFHVDRSGGSTTLPASLPGPALPDPAQARRTRTFSLGVTNGTHTLNGLTYDLNRLDFTVPAGEVEIWEFANATNNYHPMHAHGAFFRVLTRNGVPAALPADRGWRDTVLVHPNETVRVAVRFGGRPGEFLLHCHNLEHEHEMMQNFAVTVPAPPTLESRRAGADVVVRWPAPADGWVLETSADLRTWSAAPGAPTLVDGWLEWRSPATGAARFHRLVLP